jgi:hypothetical protein
MPIRLLWIFGLSGIAVAASCSGGLDPSAATTLSPGTWGGENAGMIVADSVAHVHVGCTYGNFRIPVPLAQGGRLEVQGEYLLRAYPIAVGPTLPAEFKGTLRNNALEFTVTVHDTVAKQTVVLGPATVVFGREPKLGPCPICAVVRSPNRLSTDVDGRGARGLR